MSLSYNARVVYGFRFVLRPVQRSRMKYDENTGRPYTIPERHYDEILVQDVMVGDTRLDPDRLCTSEHYEGLEVLESGYEEGTKVLGVVLARVDDYGEDCVAFTSNIPNQVIAFSKKYGVIPERFLMLSCG